MEQYISKLLQLEPITPKMSESSWTNILESLEGFTKGNFCYKIVNEQFVKESVMTTVELYIPGRVFTGRALCKMEDYANAHLHALVDASRLFSSSDGVLTPSEQFSPDDILGMVNSAVQADNYTDKVGKPTDEIPMDAITDKGQDDIHKVDGFAPQEHRTKYTQNEIKFLRQMQIDLDIKTPEEFGKYVHSWSKGKYSSKSDINPDNVQSFIQYIKSLGETSN